MKYFYIGIAILGVLLGACVASSVFLNRSTAEAERWLAEADEAMAADDTARAVRAAASAERAWARREEVLGTLLSHEELDEIAVAFADLRVYGAEAQREEFRVRCGELRFRLRHVAQIDLPFYYNLL